MRRVRRVFAFGAAMLLALSAAACVGRTGESASSAAGSAGQEQAAVPQISGTVLAASRQSLVLRTPAGEDTVFYTENLQAAELAEGEWVSVEYEPATDGAQTEPAVTAVRVRAPAAKQQAEKTQMQPLNQSVYTTGPVDIRSSYSTDSNVITTVGKGTRLQWTGACVNGWKRILFNGQTCYLFGDYVSETPPAHSLPDVAAARAAALQQRMYAAQDLRLYESAAAVRPIGYVKKGEALLQTGTVEQNWAQVAFEDGVAYCDAEYLLTSQNAAQQGFFAEETLSGAEKVKSDTVLYARERVRLRALPGQQGIVSATAPKNSALYVTGVLAGQYAEVQYAGKTLYCENALLSETQPAEFAEGAFRQSEDTVYTICALRLGQQPGLGAKPQSTVRAGARLQRTGVSENGQWSRVRFFGAELYCPTQYLAAERPAAVTAKKTRAEQKQDIVCADMVLALQGGCAQDAQIFAVVAADTRLQRLAVLNNGWTKVLYQNVESYCASEYLAVSP